MQIEFIQIKNFRAFKEAKIENVPSLCVIIGANGSGKSTLFDVFGFLKDAMTENVQKALSKRGGFREVRSRDSEGPIEFEIKFRTYVAGPLVTYFLSIDENGEGGKPIVTREILKFRRGSHGRPWHFLDFNNGVGYAIPNDAEDVKKAKDLKREEQRLANPAILAIKGLGQFQRFPTVMKFNTLLEHWHVSDIHINSARQIQEDGYAEHLSREGENLSLVTQYLFENHPEIFAKILKCLQQRVPGINKVEAKITEEGRVLLKFQDGSFKDPFLARYVSDGTIKMFAYLVLLYDPAPHPLLCIEEPENQLYPNLLGELVEEFRIYATKESQVFISTHSPDLLNALNVDELYLLVKQKGYTTIKKASDDPQIVKYMEDGDKLGALWKQDFFDGVGPK